MSSQESSANGKDAPSQTLDEEELDHSQRECTIGTSKIPDIREEERKKVHFSKRANVKLIPCDQLDAYKPHKSRAVLKCGYSFGLNQLTNEEVLSVKNLFMTDCYMELEQYEHLPTHKVYVHLLAGAAAGTMEHCLFYPLDSVKTRVQSLCHCPEQNCRTPVAGLIDMVRREGLLRPLRGMSAIMTGAAPAHAFYFTIYEKVKLFLTGGRFGHHPFAYGAAGAMATVVHDAIMNPMEVVKQRMQVWASPFRNSVECARCVFNREGICAFYRSYSTQLLLNIPFQSVHFVVYEFSQEMLNPSHKYSPGSHVLSGALGGGLAAAVTTPLDACKTALNTQQVYCPGGMNGLRDAIRDISSGNSENESSSTTSDSVVEPMDIDEASVRREQLTNILRIMNAYDKEFGVTTMDDLLEQAKLYGIKKQ
uniref:Mitoferrin n=1 Tax=Trichuris muris TaxID=70415 RepID=A0A5S6QM74_TRIMR